MIPNVQVEGEPDTHPEKQIHDAYQLASGQVDFMKLDVEAHNTRVFDLMDAKDRKEYEELYVQLMKESKEGKILISSNTREVLTRSDGSTGWFKYLEWTRFDTSGILGA